MVLVLVNNNNNSNNTVLSFSDLKAAMVFLSIMSELNPVGKKVR